MARNIHQEVTIRILGELKSGSAPWVRPWSITPGGGRPRNAITQRRYQGMNTVILWLERERRGFATQEWLTYKQAEAEGAHIRKGETGTQIMYWAQIDQKNEKGEKTGASRAVPKLFHVFNRDQIEGLPAVKPDVAVVNPDGRIPAAEHLIATQGIPFVEHGGGAFYIPSADKILMPPFETFLSAAHYYATAFHEETHGTGAKHRLNRTLNTDNRTGEYAFEELVAELGAAFLCAEHGINGDLRHAGYIGSWIKLLEDDERAFSKAATAAQKAVDFMLAKAALVEDGELAKAA